MNYHIFFHAIAARLGVSLVELGAMTVVEVVARLAAQVDE